MSKLYYESSNSLSHHGIKGQKWGVRRFRNKDGSLTSRGAKRYDSMVVKDGPRKATELPMGARVDGYQKTKLPKGVVLKSAASHNTRVKHVVKRAAAFVATSTILTVLASRVSQNTGAINSGRDYVKNNQLNDTSWAEAAWKEVERI